MEAQKWHEAESIELTQWIKKVMKYTKSLPPSAIKPIAGKSVAKILFGTSNLRHAAVHRLPTSASGILNMLGAAITFAEALNDYQRAEKVAGIKSQLEACIEEIVQHQNLLQRKLTDQLEDIARRRAELNELERSSIEQMLATDKKQRTEIGSAFESFLVVSKQVSNPCCCGHTPSFDEQKEESRAGENAESSKTGTFIDLPFFTFKSRLFLYSHLTILLKEEQTLADRTNDTKDHNQSLLDQNRSQVEISEQDAQPPWRNDSDGGVKEAPEVPESTLLLSRSIKKKEKPKKGKGKRAWWFSSGDEDLPAAEESPVLIDDTPSPEDVSRARVAVASNIDWEWPQKGISNFGAASVVCAEPDNAAEETPLSKDTILAEEAVSEEGYGKEGAYLAPAAPEASQAELLVEESDERREHSLNQHDNVAPNSDDQSGPILESGIAPRHNARDKDIEFLTTPSSPAFGAVGHIASYQPHQSASSPIVISASGAAAPEAPAEGSHTIMLQIPNGSKILRAVVFIRAYTRTAILNEARAFCVKLAQDDQSLETLLTNRYDLASVSLGMYQYDMDLSIYDVEDVSSLFRTVENTGIPRFTLRISET